MEHHIGYWAPQLPHKSHSPTLMCWRASLRLSKPSLCHWLVLSKYMVATTGRVSSIMFNSPFPEGCRIRAAISAPLMPLSSCSLNISPVRRHTKPNRAVTLRVLSTTLIGPRFHLKMFSPVREMTVDVGVFGSMSVTGIWLWRISVCWPSTGIERQLVI